MARSLQGELNLRPLGCLAAGGFTQTRNLTEDRLDVTVIDNFDEDIPVFRAQYGLSGRALVQNALFPKWSRTACEEQNVYGSEIHAADSQTYRNSLSVTREFAIAAGVIVCVAIVGMGLSGGGMTAPLGGASLMP